VLSEPSEDFYRISQHFEMDSTKVISQTIRRVSGNRKEQLESSVLAKKAVKDCQCHKKCEPCNLSFDDQSDYFNHLRLTCDDVDIICDQCDQNISRKDFREHKCYLSRVQPERDKDHTFKLLKTL